MRKFFFSIGIFLSTLIVGANILLFTSFGNKILIPILQAGINAKLPIRTQIQSLQISFGNIKSSFILADTLQAQMQGRYSLKGFDLLIDFAPTDEVANTLKQHLNAQNPLAQFLPNTKPQTLQNKKALQNPQTQNLAQDFATNPLSTLFKLRLVGKYNNYIIASIKEPSDKESNAKSSVAPSLDLPREAKSSAIFSPKSNPNVYPHFFSKPHPLAIKASQNTINTPQNSDFALNDFATSNNVANETTNETANETAINDFFLDEIAIFDDDFVDNPQNLTNNVESNPKSDLTLEENIDSSLDFNLLDLPNAQDSLWLDSALDYALDMMQNPHNQPPEIKIIARAKYLEITQYGLELKAFPALIASKILDLPYVFYGIFDLQAKGVLHKKREKNHIAGYLNAKNLIIQKAQKNATQSIKNERNANANLLSLQAKFDTNASENASTNEKNLLTLLSINLKSSIASAFNQKSNTIKSRKKSPSAKKELTPNLAILIKSSTNLKTLDTNAKITDKYEIPIASLKLANLSSDGTRGEYDLEIINLINLGAMLGLKLRGVLHLQGSYDVQQSTLQGKSSTLGGVSEFEMVGENLKINSENIALEKLLGFFGTPSEVANALVGRAQINANYNFVFHKGAMSIKSSDISTNISSADLSFYGIEGLAQGENSTQQVLVFGNVLEGNELDFGNINSHNFSKDTQNNPQNNTQNNTTQTNKNLSSLSLQSTLNSGVTQCALSIDTPSERLESTRCVINLISQNLQIALALKPKNAKSNVSNHTNTQENAQTNTQINTESMPNITDDLGIDFSQNLSNPQSANVQRLQNANIMEGLEINISGDFASPQVQKKLPELPEDDEEFLEF
ncbi:hypothetical protein [Helicobacter sp. T3_23-1059]